MPDVFEDNTNKSLSNKFKITEYNTRKNMNYIIKILPNDFVTNKRSRYEQTCCVRRKETAIAQLTSWFTGPIHNH